MALFSFLRELLGRTPQLAEDEPGDQDALASIDQSVAEPQAWDDEEPPWWVPRGAPVTEPPAAIPDDDLVEKALYDECVAALDNPNLELPQLPQITQQLLLMLHGDDVDLRHAAEVASRDAALASQVLRLANSVAYRRGAEIRSLDDAFIRLGCRSIRSLVLASTMKDVAIRTGGAQRSLGEELWRRSIASAVVVGTFARQYGMLEEDAFLTGLLHDIGLLGILKVTHDFQQRGHRRARRAVFDALAERWHEHLGLRLAEAWNLPDPLPAIIGSHHRTPAEDDALRTHRLLVQFADVVCALLEYAPYVPYDLFNVACVRQLGLEDTPDTQVKLHQLPGLIAEHMEPVS